MIRLFCAYSMKCIGSERRVQKTSKDPITVLCKNSLPTIYRNFPQHAFYVKKKMECIYFLFQLNTLNTVTLQATVTYSYSTHSARKYYRLDTEGNVSKDTSACGPGKIKLMTGRQQLFLLSCICRSIVKFPKSEKLSDKPNS